MTAPEPLVPAEVDLRDFQFMPLDVRRLRDSRLVTVFPPEQVVAAVMLWCASWHQVPAASIPDDDVELSQLAGYGRAVEVFKALKAGALHQFVKCSDGRLYHPVVAEKALTAWAAKVETAYRRDRDRYRKANGKEAPFPDVEGWNRERVSNGINLEFRWKPHAIPLEVHSGSGGVLLEKTPNSTTTVSGFSTKGEGEVRDRDRDRDRENTKPKAARLVPPVDNSGRCGHVSTLLRAAGVQVASQNHMLSVWVEELKATDEQITEAIERARMRKPEPGKIPVAYLDPIIRQVVMPKSARKPNGNSAAPWWGSEARIAEKGREFGVFARPGESAEDFQGRVQIAIDKHRRAGGSADGRT